MTHLQLVKDATVLDPKLTHDIMHVTPDYCGDEMMRQYVQATDFLYHFIKICPAFLVYHREQIEAAKDMLVEVCREQ